MQRYLNRLPTTPSREATRCEAFGRSSGAAQRIAWKPALFAACVLEQHGYPPLVMTFESVDGLDHVLFLYRKRGRWGTVARSRDPGLHGRKPVFRSLRALDHELFRRLYRSDR